MKRGFIRALWGIHEHEGRRFYQRRTKNDDDIRLMMKSPYSPESRVYVFGEDNYAMCQELGMDAVLVDKRPIVWDMDTEQFRHKLEVFDRAMADFDEIVFLDWDAIAVKPIPDNFWDVLAEKEPIQTSMCMYRRRKAVWRGKHDARKLSNAAFVYCRDKTITEGFIETWEELGRPWSEELAMARHIDKMNDGWKGLEHYWDNYEPHWFCMPRTYWCYPPEKYREEKDRLFHHFNKREVKKLLGQKEIKNWERWLS